MRVGLEIGVRPQANRVEIRELLQLGRKLFGFRHHRVAHQDGDDPLPGLERGPQFGPDRIVRARQPIRLPVGSDERDDRIDRRERRPDDLPEVAPGRNGVDVVEDVVLAERAAELVLEPSREERVVGPAVSAMLAIRGPGDSFGEFALLASGTRRAVSVAALERGETLSVGREAFRGLVRSHPSFMDVLVALLAERLRYSDERILAAHFLDADARVRWALLRLVPVYGDTGGVVPLTQENLAELAGTARGTVNRVLREEQDHGVVTLERGRIRVLDPEALAARVHGLPQR